MKKIGVEIPVDKTDMEKYGVELKHKNLFYTTRSFSVFVQFLKKVHSEFKPQYWITNCGLDAYLYVMF